MNEESKISQIKLLSECFAESPKTMYQAERETGVRIANICRFIDKMKKAVISVRYHPANVPYHTGKPDSIRATGNTSKTINSLHFFVISGTV